ncbi:DUF4760 domain-containing protein [Acinetobacter baumannii]|uniref:DUF4760 domain-containing protein n=1 Tax=Acinetobacter baumannii TaxID=470 RepID=UPI0013BCC71E|nr:DUF4760 domain-containing protein [Acinetobacter baumannii]NDX01671.1 DUF4760 domain-containing protein [Acinetobacter baumannii]
MLEYIFLIKMVFFVLFSFAFGGVLLFVFMYILLELLSFKNNFFLKIRSDKLILKIMIILIMVSIFIYFSFIYNEEVNKNIAFLTIILATSGWLFSNFISSRNSIRQHTVTILTQLRMSTEFMKNANKLQPLWEKKVIIDLNYYNSLKSDESSEKDSIRYILNYLEFVSAGIRQGDLDEDLVRAAQGGMFISTYKMCEPYILELNKKNKTTFEHLISIVKRWSI